MKISFDSHNARYLSLSLVLALTACGGAEEADIDFATTSEALSAQCGPEVDASIAVPSGNRFAFTLDATGVQLYQCQDAAGVPTWVFQAPEADLLRRGRVVGSHYAGPTWEYRDGSSVVGARVASFTPDPTAIPWLLLQATPSEEPGLMSNITFIQRIDTVGGIAPAASDCTVSSVGTIAGVDYTTTYVFYKAGRPPRCCR